MNILIADSGATKTHWELVNTTDKSHTTFYTQGISPFYFNETEISEILTKELLTQNDFSTVEKIFFYGTGCSQPDKIAIVRNALANTLNTENVMVEHDLLAAAKGTCGNNKGITCILGTGSNSCLYDGKNIIDNVPSLGFLLGDEGSGAWFGRKILQAYFYRELPAELHSAFENKFPFSKAEILNEVYGVKNPNSYVATFMPFISENNEHPFIKNLLSAGFQEFLTRTVLKYSEHENLPVHFIGSVAFLNKEILVAALHQFNLTAGNIFKSPMQGLLQYHLENIQHE